MTGPVATSGAASGRLGLRTKLALALAVVATSTAALLFVWVGPRMQAAFVKASDELIASSARAMQTMARSSTEQSTEVLVDVIHYTTDARRRLLADMPLSLYAGGDDLEALRTALQDRDRSRSEQLRGNVAVLAHEMGRRRLAAVDVATAELVAEQTVLADALASDLRSTSLLLTGVVLALSIALLGFGLFRVVVRPVRDLRRAANAVARGDLTVDVKATSRDEVGGLATDFAAMVQRLKVSREEIEAEVAHKTEHLERALADLRRTQRQLVHAAKMASVGTLAGGVAHEFNNLIGGIRGCAVEALADESDPMRREPLEIIVRAAARGAQVTEQLLRFARQRVHAVGPVDVAAVLDESLRLVEPRARQARVEIRRSGLDRQPARADASALHQVFLNLSTNALQAMGSGGTLSVDLTRAGDEIVVQFRDTGVGISAEQIEHVFEPFWTSRDREPDPERRGTGLGLSVSYGLIEAHGGSIVVESEPDRGSTFTVRIPSAMPDDDAERSDS